jgi:hypothetical protein
MTHLTKTSSQAHLVVIRISDSTASKELDKKTRETAAMHPTLPGAKQLAALGATPLGDPDSVGGRLVNHPGMRAVVFRLPGTDTWVLMALGSATKANLGDDDNAFVTLLADTLNERTVESIWVADFARLLRSIDYLSDTWKAIRHRCRFVRHAAAVIDTTGPTAEIQFLFEALSAAADARSVVRRTTVGKMRNYLNGKCPMARAGLPLGYTLNKDRQVVPSRPAPEGVIRCIVQVLGDPSLTHAQRVERVAAEGAISLAGSRRQRRAVKVSELNNPRDTVARWYALLDVWRTGLWVVDHLIPSLLKTTDFGLPVELIESETHRSWRMTYRLPRPAGGWATDDEFDAAKKLRDERAERTIQAGGNAPTVVRKPFSGLPDWTEGEWQYALHSRREGLYELRRRPLKDSTERVFVDGQWRTVARGWGRSPNKVGTVLGVIHAQTLHETVTSGLVEAAQRGLPLTAGALALVQPSMQLADDLRAEFAQAERRATNARRSGLDASTEALRREFLQEYETALVNKARLEEDILRLIGAGEEQRLSVNVDTVALALGRVAAEPDHVPAIVANDFRTVMAGFRLLPTNTTTANWQASLRLSVAGGTLTIGPANGTIELATGRTQAARRAASLGARAGTAAKLFMRDALATPAVATALGVTTQRRVEQAARDYLKSKGLSSEAATLLIRLAPPPARKAVWEHLHKRPLPASLNQPYAAAVAQAYSTMSRDYGVNRPQRIDRLRSVLTAVEAKGGWIPANDVDGLCEELHISPTTFAYMVTGRICKRRGMRVANPPILRAVEGGFGLIPCPRTKCGGWATTVALFPEVPTDVLCTSCLRLPDLERPAHPYPEDYRSCA